MKKIEILQEVINTQETVDLLMDENRLLSARITKLENLVNKLQYERSYPLDTYPPYKQLWRAEDVPVRYYTTTSGGIPYCAK